MGWLLSLVQFLIPRKANRWVYADGTLNSAIHFYRFCRAYDDREHIYVCRSKDLDRFRAAGVNAVAKGSLKALWFILTAKVFIIAKSSLEDLDKRLSHGALIINLFHGIPIKSIGLATYDNRSDKPEWKLQRYRKKLTQQYARYDFCCATSPFTQLLFQSAFGRPLEELPITGEPRNDFLIENRSNRQWLENKYGERVRRSKWVFAYMPTWRDYGEWQHGIDLEHLNRWLLEHDSVLILRAHPNDASFDIGERHLEAIIRSANDGGWSDAYEELAGTDALISDFSGLVFEYLLTDHPVVLYAPDYHKYLANRPLMASFDDMRPCELLTDYAALIQSLTDVVSGQYNFDRYHTVKHRLHTVRDASASQRVYDHIISRLNS
ncbi:MAG: CDP-glycerol glycerophosphotransferase family protein [Gammaproteobacteria bacterium]|nr:CDP-glycerol glycerophosphotransferase family protein [Gammaproteobacteria bacterium]